MSNEEKSNKEKWLSQLRSIENELWLDRLDELLSEYEVIDLKLKILYLKIEIENEYRSNV
jgi:hypothetical protein